MKRKGEKESWAEYKRTHTRVERDDLMDRYDGLVRKLAYHLSQKAPVEFDELLQDGRIGLLKAIEAYDPARGTDFISFAYMRVRGAMMDGIRDRDWVPRMVRRKKEPVVKVLSFDSERGVSSDSAPCSEFGFTFADDLSDPHPTPFESAEEKDSWARLLRRLSPHAADYIDRYYRADRTMREIGKEFRRSESRISQVMKDARADLKDALVA